MARGKNYVNNHRGVFLQAGSKDKTKMKLCEYGPGCTRPDCIYRHDDAGGTGGTGGSSKGEPVCVLFLAGKCNFKAKGCRKRHPSKDEVARLLTKYKKIRCHHGDDCYTDSCLFLHPRDMKDKEPVAFIEPHHFPPLKTNGDGPSPSAPKPIPNSAWNAAPVGAPNNAASTPAGSGAVHAPEQEQQPQEQQHPQQPQPMSSNGPTKETPTEQPSQQQQGQPNGGQHPQQEHPQHALGHPPAGWGYPPHMMMMPPPPPPHAYYGGPMPPMVDPATGYPIDPAYFEAGHPGMMYPQHHLGGVPPPFGVTMGMPMGTPFNAEAKEFVPGGSA